MRIRLFLFCVIGLFLTGCATASKPGAEEYLLSGKAAEPLPDAGTDMREVRIYPVRVAEFLSGNSMVILGENGQVHRAVRHLWAEPLSGQLTRTLRIRLAERLPEINWQEEAVSAEKDSPVLLVRVDAFQVTGSGWAEIRGYWKLSHPQGDLIARERFDVRRPLPDSGYPAMVRALNRGWNEVVDDLARKMAKIRSSG